MISFSDGPAATQNPSSAIFMQLELTDFSRLGSNPLELLRRTIPGYRALNDRDKSDRLPSP